MSRSDTSLQPLFSCLLYQPLESAGNIFDVHDWLNITISCTVLSKLSSFTLSSVGSTSID